MIKRNNLIRNTGKPFAMSFHQEQMIVPLTLHLTFKFLKIIYQSDLRFLGIYIIGNPCQKQQ